jgi:hypothetical protein
MSEYNINAQFTLLERAKMSVDGKRVLPVLDVMDKMGVDSFLRDVPWFQANQGLKHRITRTTDRPTSTMRTFYKGVAKTTSTVQTIFEPVSLFEQRSGVDEDEVDTIENGNELRRMKDMPHAAGILDDFVYAIFNSNRTSGGEYIDGLKARMGTLSSPESGTGALPYVWDNGGAASTGSLCSLWIVEWGPQAVHCLYPSGQAVRGGGPFGMSIRNKGKEAVVDPDDSTATYYEYVTQFKFWFGLAVHNDWKIARIANINKNPSGSGVLDDNVIIKALNHGKFSMGATRMYANPWLTTQIEIKAKDKNNVLWSTMDVFGREVPAIRGVPLRKLDDTILPATESAITT